MGAGHARAFVLEKRSRDLDVEVVVLDEQHVQSLDAVRLLVIFRAHRLLGDIEGDGHDKGASLSLDARNLDGAAHAVDDALGDRHAQAGTLMCAGCAGDVGFL